MASWIKAELLKRGVAAVEIHGGRTQGQRETALAAFRDGSAGVLVATDVAARGIDVPEVEHVVQAVMPSTEVREKLAMANDEPCLRLRRRTWKAGQVVTAVWLHYPGNRYDLTARYAPNRYPGNSRP